MLHSLLGYEIHLSIICSEHHIQFTRCFKISTFPCGVRHIFCNGVRPRLVRLAYYSYVLSYCHFHDSSLLPCRKHFFFSACRPILNISLGKRENAYNACLHGPKPKFRRKGIYSGTLDFGSIAGVILMDYKQPNFTKQKSLKRKDTRLS